MPVYLVRIHATGLRAAFEGSEKFYDLLKNEYVRASDAREAIARAQASVRHALRNKPLVNLQDVDILQLDVDELKENQSVIKLFAKEGFVFSPTGVEDDDEV